MKKLFTLSLLAVLATGCASKTVVQDNAKTYVVEREREALFVLDGKTEKEIKDLGNLNHATMKFRGKYGYLLARDGFISKIDTETDSLVKKVKIGKSGIGITFIKSYVAIVNYDPQSVVLLDEDLNVVKTILTESRNVGIKAFKNFLVFSLMDKNAIWVVDADKNFEVIKKLENVGELPFDALIKDEKYIVGFFNEAAIGILDVEKLEYRKVSLKDMDAAPVYKVPHFGYWGIVGSTAIVPIVAQKKLLVLNLENGNPQKEIKLIGDPVFASVSPDKSKLIVNYSGDKENFISVIDLKKMEAEKDIEVGRRVMHLRFSPSDERAFVTTYFDNQLKVLDTKDWKILEERTVATPSGIFISSMKE